MRNFSKYGDHLTHSSLTPALLIGILILSCTTTHNPDTIGENEGWIKAAMILKEIIPPTFRDQNYPVDPQKDKSGPGDRTRIQRQIDRCALEGGGTVLLTSGNYLSRGPIYLKSNVNLQISEGAVLNFDTIPQAHTPLVKVRWEGTVCWNYSPMIYAYREKNIGLSGGGVVNGHSLAFWSKWRAKQNPDKDILRQMGNDRIPEDQRVFGTGFLDRDQDGVDDGYGDGKVHFLRPTLVEFYECENILIEDLTFKESPFWTLHPVFSQNITMRNLSIFGGSVNDDGIDPDGCKKMLIENCYIETRDDAISVKAGRDQDAWNRPGTEDIIVRRCTLKTGVNAFCVGSEMSGGVQNIFVEDCKVLSAKHALNFKCNLDRGGEVSNIYMRNIDIDSCEKAMFIFRMDYHGYRGNNFPTKFHHFYASGIDCQYAGATGFQFVGVPAEPISDIFLHNIKIGSADTLLKFNHVERVVSSDIRFRGKTVTLPPKS